MKEKKRMKQLWNYPLISEEMKISPKFINNDFELNNVGKAVALEVGIDDENENHNKINLVLRFGEPNGYKELVFYFNVTNENNEISTSQKSIYDRKIAKEYLPKDLIGKNIFKDKVNKMFEKLITMEKPKIFFMETYEDYANERPMTYYLELVDLILKNGYTIESQGVNILKKFYWKFIDKKTLNLLPEQMIDIDWSKQPPRDEKWYQRYDESSQQIMFEIYNSKKR